ncbi:MULTISPECIES: divergent PAP2 family protein [Eubacteriales]|uniref:divergent PAP2 family protein n=1 Tax=Eubacteriales TaxID=186802 RepID=UPI00068084F4|nr:MULTISPECIES: divergent PAP2 family protein [Eubacteriales]
MNWQLLISNRIINVGFISWMLSQLIKTGIYLLQNRKFNIKRLSESGGMPSAHSALGCSVAIATVQEMGFVSPMSAIVLTFAAVIMYDAMGVRRAAGEQAKAINQITDYLEENDSSGKAASLRESIGTLEISLGHTPFEVLCGALLGICVALLSA